MKSNETPDRTSVSVCGKIPGVVLLFVITVSKSNQAAGKVFGERVSTKILDERCLVLLRLVYINHKSYSKIF